MSTPSALASLTAVYTDSEGEGEQNSEGENEPHSPKESNNESADSQANPPTRESSPMKIASAENSSTPPSQKKALRLVSYNDNDEQMSDDDNPYSPKDESNIDIVKTDVYEPPAKLKAEDLAKKYGFSLPPEPKGKCASELQEKVSSSYEKMKTKGVNINHAIQNKKDFRNPSIYEKLIQFCDINELGTNYPAQIYDPGTFGKESFYEELAKVQKIEMDKLEKQKKENAQTTIAAKKAEEEAKKRKSKWDQPAPGVLSKVPSLTATTTGKKTTVITAFGKIAKKSKE